MSDFREEEKLGKLYDSQLTRRLMQYLRPYRLQVVLAVSFTLGITALEIAGPYLFHIGIDSFIVPGYEGKLARTAALLGLLWVVFAYAGSILASFGLQYVQVRIMQWVGQETMYDLRKEIFEHLQRLPMSFFDRSPIGRSGDALHHRRGRAQRPLRFRGRGHVERFRSAVCDGCGAIQVASHPRSGDSFASAVHDPAHVFLPEPRTRCQPAHSHGHCAHQRVLAGARQRNGRRAALQSRAEIAQAIRGAESHPHGGVQGRD